MEREADSFALSLEMRKWLPKEARLERRVERLGV